jgi:hypothetical protein
VLRRGAKANRPMTHRKHKLLSKLRVSTSCGKSWESDLLINPVATGV